MSTRTLLKPFVVINAGDMSANITSTVTIIQSPSIMGYQAYWTGTSPVGTLSLQMSWDYAVAPNGQTVLVAGHWTTMTLNVAGAPSTTVAVSGNSGSTVIDPIRTGNAGAMRLIYTFGSGTGSLTAMVSGKVT